MKKIYLVENNCCGSGFTELTSFLAKRFANEAEVIWLNLAKTKETSIIPKSIRTRVETAGLNILPAIIVNDVIVSEGHIPNFLDVVQMVESGKPSESKLIATAVPKKACCGS